MRRTVITVGLGLLLAGSSACASSSTDPQSLPTTPAATSAAPKLDDKATTCTSAKAVMAQALQKFSELARPLFAAQSDPARFTAAAQPMVAFLNDTANKLAKIMGTAGDTEAKAALTALVAAFTKMKTGMAQVTDFAGFSSLSDSAGLDSAEAKLTALCS
jgi:hypothetical protein